MLERLRVKEHRYVRKLAPQGVFVKHMHPGGEQDPHIQFSWFEICFAISELGSAYMLGVSNGSAIPSSPL